MKKILSLACFVCALVLQASAHAQPYPSKPIRLVVPYAPGGSQDVVARLLAQRVSETIGQSVVVDNQAGAGGQIATQLVARSAADGYTLLLSTGAQRASYLRTFRSGWCSTKRWDDRWVRPRRG